MSELKCPFCQQELDYLSEDIYGSRFCPNCDCLGWVLHGNDSMWQELTTTRKALDLALGVLKGLKPEKAKGGGYWTYRTADVIKVINKALKQINEIKGGKDGSN